PPMAMDAGANDFDTESELRTSSVALAAARFEPAFVVVRPPAAMVFTYGFGVALVTLTVTVHEPLAGMVAPESATEVPALAAVTVPPAHVVAPAGVAVFTRPAGYVSVKAAPVIAVAFGLVRVIVSTEAAFGATDAGANALAMVGRASTVSVAEAPAA